MPGTGIFSLKPFLLRKRSGSCDSNYSQKIGFSETRLLAFQGGQVEGNEDVPPPFASLSVRIRSVKGWMLPAFHRFFCVPGMLKGL